MHFSRACQGLTPPSHPQVIPGSPSIRLERLPRYTCAHERGIRLLAHWVLSLAPFPSTKFTLLKKRGDE